MSNIDKLVKYTQLISAEDAGIVATNKPEPKPVTRPKLTHREVDLPWFVKNPYRRHL